MMVVALVARIAEDEGRFDLAAVAGAVADKLVRRHPHVFGDVRIEGSKAVLANWERIKQEERRGKETDASALAGVPRALPALQRADRLAAKAISAGFEWDDARGALAKLEEEVRELRAALDEEPRATARVEAELGDVLMAAAFLGRYVGVDPESATRTALRRFEERFRHMEGESERPLGERPLEDLLRAWERAKDRVG